MSVADWFQAISLAAVAAALLLSVWQSRELSRQTAAATTSAKQSAYHALVTHPTAFRVAMLREDPGLLSWHLAGRGFEPASPEENLRRLFMLMKLEMHELNFISFSQGLLTEDLWTGWRNTLLADFATPEFRYVWRHVRTFYAPSFIAFADFAATAGTLTTDAGAGADLPAST